MKLNFCFCKQFFLLIGVVFAGNFSMLFAKMNDVQYLDNFKELNQRRKIAESFIQPEQMNGTEDIEIANGEPRETAVEHFKNDFETPIPQSSEVFWENSHFQSGSVAYPIVLIESFFNYEDENSPNSEIAAADPKSKITDIEAIQKEPEEGSTNDPNIGPPYRLHIGDALLISVYGEAETRREVVVDPSGSISYLIVNSYTVIGKTINEVRLGLEEKLKRLYKHALVVVSAIHFAEEYYNIVGEVRRPGKFPIRGDSTLLSAICESSGFNLGPFRDTTINLEDLDHSFIARRGEYLPVDFTRLIEQGDLTQDIPLKAGDYIYIASANAKQIFVLGEVSIPTTLNYWREKITLAQAVAQAGGTTLVASSRVAVIRGSLACPVHFLIDFNRIQKGYACDFVLEAGDIVYVPPRNFTFLREIIKAGIATFVSTAASVAGFQLFISTTPAAGLLGSGAIAPVPVLPLGTSTSSFIAPAASSPVLLPAH
jgi:polysaccharide biosynthesis/export protein